VKKKKKLSESRWGGVENEKNHHEAGEGLGFFGGKRREKIVIERGKDSGNKRKNLGPFAKWKKRSTTCQKSPKGKSAMEEIW